MKQMFKSDYSIKKPKQTNHQKQKKKKIVVVLVPQKVLTVRAKLDCSVPPKGRYVAGLGPTTSSANRRFAGWEWVAVLRPESHRSCCGCLSLQDTSEQNWLVVWDCLSEN